MVHFVFFLQASQNCNGGLDTGLTHNDFLEAPFKRRILFNEFSVFIQRGRSHTMQLSPRQSGLEHIAGIHRTLGLSCAYHGMELVNENDGLPFIFGQLVQNSF